MATKFKSGNGTWFVQFKDVDGKWKKKRCGKSATAADAETIRKIYDAQELNRRHSAIVRIVDMDIYDALAEYRDTIIPRSNTGRPKSQKSIQREKATVNNLIEWLQKKNVKKYSDVHNETVTAFFDYMIGPLERSASTIQHHRRAAINFFKWSIEKGYTTTNPAAAIKAPKREKRVPRYFSEDELQKIFDAADDIYKNVFKFLYLTGLRIGELGNLEWSDYNAERKHIVLRVMEGNKTKREEIVPLNASAIEILETLKKEPPRKYIFVGDNGVKLKNTRIYKKLWTILKNNKIENASPHTFRHTCASHLAIKGVSLYIIKEILRHASIKETEIYAHLSKEAVAGAIEKLSA